MNILRNALKLGVWCVMFGLANATMYQFNIEPVSVPGLYIILMTSFACITYLD